MRGKNGYASAPVERTSASGWLWSWALAIPRTSTKSDLAWRYIAWATGPRYTEEAGPRIAGGWAAIPPGTRRSTYEIPEYRKAARAFAKPTLDAIESAPIDDPGTSRRPGNPGIQYVGIPQFQDVGNQCTEQFAAVIRAQVDDRFGARELRERRLRGSRWSLAGARLAPAVAKHAESVHGAVALAAATDRADSAGSRAHRRGLHRRPRVG